MHRLAAVFLIAPNWNNPRVRRLGNDRYTKSWYVHTVNYYSATKGDELDSSDHMGESRGHWLRGKPGLRGFTLEGAMRTSLWTGQNCKNGNQIRGYRAWRWGAGNLLR